MGRVGVGAQSRMAGYGHSRRSRSLLLLSTALGCSLLVVAAPGVSRAASECGTASSSVTCPAGDYPAGISYLGAPSMTLNLSAGTTAESTVKITGAGDYVLNTGTDTLIATTGDIVHAVVLTSTAGSVSATTDAVSTTGDSAEGIFARTTTGDITINAGVTSTSGDYIYDSAVNPDQAFPDAITAITDSGTISITSQTASADGAFATAIGAVALNGGDVTIDSGSASGAGAGGVVVQADASAAAGSTVAITSDQITNSGDGKASLVAIATGDIGVDSGSIVSTGHSFYDTVTDQTLNSSGITTRSYQGDITIASDSVSTQGDFATGIYARADEGSVSITSGDISAASGRGIQARAADGVSIDSGTVSSVGNGAHGVMVTAGAGPVVVDSDAITTSGAGSHGIYVANADGADIAGVGAWRAATGGTGTLTIDSGSIDASGWGMMIDHQGAIDITSDTITSGGPGIYLYGGDAVTIDSASIETQNGPGIITWADDGAVNITSGHVLVGAGGDVGVFAKTISGDISINAGDTTTTATGLLFGSYTADAIGAVSNTGDIAITSDSTSTVGIYSSGIFGITGGDLSITSDSIENGGDNGNGILAIAEGAIAIDSGSIHTTGVHDIGMIIDAGAGDVTIASDDIVTDGADSHGIYVANASGDYISGIGSWRAATGGTGTLTINSGAIDAGAWGMMIDHQGAIDITSDTISSQGAGIYLYGGDAVTVASTSIETQNGTGIVTWADEGAVNITSGHVLIGAGGDIGIFAKTTSGDIVINAGDTTTTATGLLHGSYTADGVGAVSDTGDISITSGSVSTKGLQSTGLYAFTDGDVSITSGSIVNAGAEGNGLFTDGGDVTIDSGDISTTGAAAFGMRVSAAGAASVTSESITTTGGLSGPARAYGMQVQSTGGAVSVTSGSVSTAGDRAFGIAVTSSADADVTLSSGSVSTAGGGARGLYAYNTDAGNVSVTSGSVVTTGGVFNGFVSEGIRVEAGTGAITLVSGSVTTEGDGATGIVTQGGGHVSISSGSIDASGEGASAISVSGAGSVTIAIDNGASVHGQDGAILVHDDSDTTLNIAGRVDAGAGAAVQLSGGDDTINLLDGGALAGLLDAGAGDDSLVLNSSVNSYDPALQSIDDIANVETLNVANGYWTLTGAADTAGATTITGGTLKVTGALSDDVVIGSGGTLQIGDGGTAGDVFGDLVIDGTAIFDRSDEYDFAGDVSGSGALVKQGDASLILSGAYDFTGTTQVQGGTIKIINLPHTAEIVVDDGVLDLSGTDQELASLSGGSGGTVDVDGGSLTVNQDGATEFAGAITGDGSLTLTGGGTLNLTGDNTYTGPTTIDDGLLKVNGSITSDVTVNDGGALGGSGTIGGDVSVGDGALVGPGNSPGTLTVAGDFTFAAGSTYVAEVLATGEHDQINVSGATTIGDGATLAIMAGNGDYARLSTYTLLHSVGGLSGAFDTVTTNLAFLTPHLTYTTTDLTLALTRNDVSFASLAATANQTNVATAIEAAGYGDALYDALVVQSAAGSQRGYTALSGEFYPALDSVLLQQSRYHRDAILERAASTGEGRWGWGQLIGADLRFKSDADNARIDSDARGLITGLDMSSGAWRAGVAVSYLKSDVDSGVLASKADVKSTTLSAYAGTRVGALKASFGASFTHHGVEANRVVAFPSFADAPKAAFDANTGEVFAEVSVQQQLAGVVLEPFLGISYESLHVDGFTEEGGDAALDVNSARRKVSTATLGVRASSSFETSVGTVTPYATIAWRGVSGDKAEPLGAAFQNGAAYKVTGAPLDDGLVYDLGVRVSTDRMGFTAAYSGMNTDRWRDQQARVGVSVRF